MNDYMFSEIMEENFVLKEALYRNKQLIGKIGVRIKENPVSGCLVVARGTSDHVCTYAKYLGEYKLGIPFTPAASSVINLYQSRIDLSTMLTLAISQSGESPDVVGVVEEAGKQGSVTVGITNNEDSRLAGAVEYPLLCYAGPERSVAATKTCTTSMMVAASLITELAGDFESRRRLEKISPAVKRLTGRYSEIKSLAEKFKDIDKCLILARGFNYCGALETALKIQETCYINARGFSTADFMHGPIAVLEEGYPVIVFAFKGPALPSMTDALTRLGKVGAKTLIVTNDVSLTKINGYGNMEYFYITEDLEDEYTPFLSIVFGQIFAYFLSKVKGYNPDYPRSLKKVTRTL